jgi:hypothetical protein
MPITAPYLFIVSMDVAPDKEALFNEVYDEHIGFISQVPGVRAVSRWKTEPASSVVGGVVKPIDTTGAPRYIAVYEIDSPDLPASKAWDEASEKGRWAKEVRPHTFNRSHMVRKAVQP